MVKLNFGQPITSCSSCMYVFLVRSFPYSQTGNCHVLYKWLSCGIRWYVPSKSCGSSNGNWLDLDQCRVGTMNSNTVLMLLDYWIAVVGRCKISMNGKFFARGSHFSSIILFQTYGRAHAQSELSRHLSLWWQWDRKNDNRSLAATFKSDRCSRFKIMRTLSHSFKKFKLRTYVSSCSLEVLQ